MSATGNNLPEHAQNALGAYDTPLELCRAIYRRGLDLGILTRDTPILEPHVGSGNFLKALVEEGHRGEIEVMDLDDTAPGLALGRSLQDMGTPTVHVLGEYAPTDHLSRQSFEVRMERDGIPAHRRPLALDGFLSWRPVLADRPDLVILGNPPYSVVPAPETCPRCSGVGRVLMGPRATLTKPCPECLPKEAKLPKGQPDDGRKGTGKIQPGPIATADYHVLRGLMVARTVIYVLRGPFREGQERYRELYERGQLREAWTSPRRASFAWGATDSVETAVFVFDRDRVPDAIEGPSYTGRWITW